MAQQPGGGGDAAEWIALVEPEEEERVPGSREERDNSSAGRRPEQSRAVGPMAPA